MTALLLFIKHHLQWIWNIIEALNGALFRLRYPRWKDKAGATLRASLDSNKCAVEWSLVTEEDLPALSTWLLQQSTSAQQYFRPHGFQLQDLQRLWKNPAFLLIKVSRKESSSPIIGYHFLRCFCIGRAFHGLIVDPLFSGQGIGAQMWKIAYQIAQQQGITLFATISENNLPSLSSAQKSVVLEVKKLLPQHYRLYLITGLRP